MLSPILAPPPSQSIEGSSSISPTTRRRGLSYLRSLSIRDHNLHASAADPPRPSPRNFFTRSTSYQETKDSPVSDGRRRSQSHSRPYGLVIAPASAVAPVRVASECGPETQAETAILPTTDLSSTDEMTRTRPPSSRRQVSGAEGTSATEPPALTRNASANGDAPVVDPHIGLPTLRLFPHQESNRAGRQSLNFAPVSRTLPNDGSIIRVGRYSEREGPAIAQPTGPSEAPVGFKSKVVSRKHCEFSFADGQWQIRDVSSSSGTFLNHIRLSQPGLESRLYPIKDGDIIQLGIDFRGGEEMIFRCVKIRVECNRAWQKKPNNFNKQRQAQLRGLAKDQPAANSNTGECTICLGNVLPCQALFVAPCAHCWHYKCIRPMLEGRQSNYPQFQCPNCRLFSDLDADVDIDMADWAEDDSADQDKDLDLDQAVQQSTRRSVSSGDDPHDTTLEQIGTNTSMDGSRVVSTLPVSNIPTSLSNSSLLSRRQERATSSVSDTTSPPIQSIPLPTRPTEAEIHDHLAQQKTQTETPNGEQVIVGEGPLTPRNNAGPFVFDGSGSRSGTRRYLHVPTTSLDEISDGVE